VGHAADRDRQRQSWNPQLRWVQIPAEQAIVDPLVYFGSTAPALRVLATAVTVSPGAATGNTSAITVTPGGGFTGAVTLTAAVTSGPAGAQDPPTLSFGSTSPLTIAGAIAGGATLTVSTTAATSVAAARTVSRGAPWPTAAALACILLLGLPPRRRSLLVMLVLLVAVAGGVMACGGASGGGGGGGGGNPGTTAGAYTVTVTASSNATQATGTFVLTVE
jgi:hypothetical protein